MATALLISTAAAGAVATGTASATSAPLASTSASPGSFVALTPARLLDTRAGTGAPAAPIGGQGTLTLHVTGHGGVPTTGASVVVVNLTVTNTTSPGFISAYPTGTRPATSNLNYAAGQTVANAVTVPLAADGTITLFNGGTTHPADLIADVNGYYLSGTPTTAGAFAPLTPARLLDTRAGTGAPAAPIGGQGTLTLHVTGHGGVPTTGASAVVVNLTVTNTTSPGFISAYPTGTRPATSNLNYAAGQTVANAVTVPLAADGTITLFNGGTTHPADLIADVNGYYLDAASFRWGEPQKIDNGGTGFGRISCPSSTFCAAVDDNSAVFYDGSRWSSPVMIDPNSGVMSVSCSSPAFCVAGDVQGEVVVWNGTAWSAPRDVSDNNPIGGYIDQVSCHATTCLAIDNSGHAFTSDDGFVTFSQTTDKLWYPSSLSCPSATFCALGTQYGDVYTFDGSTWSDKTHVVSGGLQDMDCVSATSCVAVLGNDSVAYDGHTWTEHAIPSGSSVFTVACQTATSCLGGDQDGRVFTWNGSTWGAPVAVSNAAIGDLACSSSTSCWAVDRSGAASHLSGGRWSTPQVVDSVGGVLTGISCPSTTFCAVVDGGVRDGGALTYNGTVWSTRTSVAPSPGLNHVACASSTFCVTGTDTGVAGYDGTTWTPLDSNGVPRASSCSAGARCAVAFDIPTVEFYGPDGTVTATQVPGMNSAQDISCATDGTCMALDIGGDAATWDGTAWSVAPSAPVNGNLEFVSCTARDFCMASDSSGGYSVFNGSTWSVQTHAPTAGPTGLSCSSPTLCVAVDAAADAVVWDGTSWSAPATLDSGHGGLTPGLSGVSCTVGTRTCTVVTRSGDVISGHA